MLERKKEKERKTHIKIEGKREMESSKRGEGCECNHFQRREN